MEKKTRNGYLSINLDQKNMTEEKNETVIFEFFFF